MLPITYVRVCIYHLSILLSLHISLPAIHLSPVLSITCMYVYVWSVSLSAYLRDLSTYYVFLCTVYLSIFLSVCLSISLSFCHLSGHRNTLVSALEFELLESKLQAFLAFSPHQWRWAPHSYLLLDSDVMVKYFLILPEKNCQKGSIRKNQQRFTSPFLSFRSGGNAEFSLLWVKNIKTLKMRNRIHVLKTSCWVEVPFPV